jgi:hypothetical protein
MGGNHLDPFASRADNLQDRWLTPIGDQNAGGEEIAARTNQLRVVRSILDRFN